MLNTQKTLFYSLFSGFVLILIMSSSVLAEDEYGIKASTDRKTAAVGDRIILTVTVSSKNSTSVQPVAPELKNFDVMGTSSSNRISIVKGSQYVEMSNIYLLRPIKYGKLVIGEFTLNYNDSKNISRSIKTVPIMIDVPEQEGEKAAEDTLESLINSGSANATLENLIKMANSGEVEAQNKLGNMYYKGEGVSQDYQKAIEWYKKAALRGHAKAQYNLGILYNGGKIIHDNKAAIECYEKAAKQGYAPAQCALGLIYKQFRRVETYRVNNKAQHNLDILYNGGAYGGFRQDDRKAFEWFEKASMQGYAPTQYFLGVMYDSGEGVPKDYKKAIEWYEKASLQNYAEAQNNLGTMYAKGEGVSQDNKKAIECYEKAAMQGNTVAQNNLGTMYANGEGVPKDVISAYAYFNIAASYKNSDSIGYRNLLQKEMTSVQIEKAQALSQEIFKKIEENKKKLDNAQ